MTVDNLKDVKHIIPRLHKGLAFIDGYRVVMEEISEISYMIGQADIALPLFHLEDITEYKTYEEQYYITLTFNTVEEAVLYKLTCI